MIEKILLSFKRIFGIKDKPEDNHIKQENKPKKNPVKEEKSQPDLFDSLKQGDLIYARMPLKKEELEEIPEGHRARPYLAVSRNKDNIYAYYCTSSEPENKNRSRYYKLSQKKYDLFVRKEGDSPIVADTYVHLGRPIRLNREHVLYFMSAIDEYDLCQINKMISLLNDDRLFRFRVANKVYPGEIYRRGRQLYYVYRIEEGKNLCYKMHEQDNTRSYALYLNGKKYHVAFGRLEEVDLSGCRLFALKDPSITNRVENLKESYNTYKKIKRNKEKQNTSEDVRYHKVFTVGGIYENFDTGKNMVYLYSIGSNNQGFEFSENADPDKIKIVYFPIRKQQKSVGKAKRDLMMKVIESLSEDDADLKSYFSKNYQY